jgi:iron complex transport system substrate-binding protein
MPVRRTTSLRAVTALLMVLGITLTACGRDTNTNDKTGAGASGGNGAFPVSVEHKFGTITVPAKPERVVSIGYKEQDWLYEFGVQPVAVRKWYGRYDHEINPWAEYLVSGGLPEVLGDELDLEQIAALEPDLIVGVYSGITEEQYEQLSMIAPTLAGPVGSTDYNEPWREMTRLIGTAVGQADRAEEVVAEIEGLFEEAKEEHPEFDGAEVITAAAWTADSTGVYTSGDPRAEFLAELGMQTPPEVDELAEDGSFWAPVSAELIGDTFDRADDAVVVIGAPSEEEPGASDVLEDASTFATSRVSEEGRVVLLDTPATDIAFSFASPLSIRFTLAHLVPQLAAAIDGDPATVVPASPETVA